MSKTEFAAKDLSTFNLSVEKIIEGEWIIHYSAKLSNNLLRRSLEGPTNNVAIVIFKEGQFINKKTNFNHDTIQTRIENYNLSNDTIFFIDKNKKYTDLPRFTVECINQNKIILRNIQLNHKNEVNLIRVKKFKQGKNIKKVMHFLTSHPIEITETNENNDTSKSKFDFMDQDYFMNENYDNKLTWNLIDNVVDHELFVKFHRRIYPIQVTRIEENRIHGIRYGKNMQEVVFRKQDDKLEFSKLLGKWDLINTHKYPYDIEDKYYKLIISNDKIVIWARRLTKDTKTYYYKLSQNKEILYMSESKEFTKKDATDLLFIKDIGENIAKISIELSDGSSFTYLMERAIY